MNQKCAKIHLTYSPLLIFQLFKKHLLFNNINIKYFYGIYIETENQDKPIINNLKEIKDYPTISYHIIRLAYRFKRFKIHKREKNYYSLPFSDDIEISIRNTISTIDLIRKRYRFNNEEILVYLKRFQDKYINIFLMRYYKRNHNINLKFVQFSKEIKTESQIVFNNKKYSILSILSIFKRIPFKNKNNLREFRKKKILEVSSMNKIKEPYRLPKNNILLNKMVCSIDFNDIYKYGLNKQESLIFILREFRGYLKKMSINDIYSAIKHNLFIDYLQISINKLYINNISIFLNNIDIKYLFCSHRSFYFEKLIYKACKLNNIKSISYDFSLGYPLRNTYKKEVSLTAHPDIYIVSSTLRQGHYKYANMDYINSGNSLEIVNCSCIQVEYARSKIKNSYKISKNFRQNIISIFDNNYGENASIRFKYTKDLGKILFNYRNNISCITHSKIKYFYLENELRKNKIRYIKAHKGDFNLAAKSNLIISIGFQGAAIKAAFAFNKPIIFFSSDKNYYKNLIFSDNNQHNEITLEKFKKLIFNKHDIEELLSSGNQYDSSLDRINSISTDFLGLIGISNEIPNIFSYLANL